jgi:hypothetical protein
VDILLKDVKRAFRALAAAPGFSVAAIISLAIGISANTAIFSIIDGLLIRPLPYANADGWSFCGTALRGWTSRKIGSPLHNISISRMAITVLSS